MITLPPNIHKYFKNDYIPYIMNTYTESSFLESILMCFDSELFHNNSENVSQHMFETFSNILQRFHETFFLNRVEYFKNVS